MFFSIIQEVFMGSKRFIKLRNPIVELSLQLSADSFLFQNFSLTFSFKSSAFLAEYVAPLMSH